MKKLLFISAFLLLIGAQTGYADLFLQPQSATINVGDPLTVDVMISGVNSPWLHSYAITINFDPAILSSVTIAWPDNFLGFVTTRDTAFGTGWVRVHEFDMTDQSVLAYYQSGHDPFRLFELIFSEALTPGVSPLTFANVILYDGSGTLITSQSSTSGSVTVAGTPVPEPATMLLLGSGLMGLIGFRRKFK